MNENNNRTSLSATPLERASGDESLEAKAGPRLDSRFHITVISYRKRRHDPDGISVKAVLDGLTRRGILRDDSWEEIKSITFESRKCKKGDEEKTIIELKELV